MISGRSRHLAGDSISAEAVAGSASGGRQVSHPIPARINHINTRMLYRAACPHAQVGCPS